MIFYIIAIILLFLIVNYLEKNFYYQFLHELILILIYFLFVGGIFNLFHVSTYYLYTIMLFVSMIEIMLLYYKELNSSRNPYSFYRYLFFVLFVYLLNRGFIDKLDFIFPTLGELKILIWIMVLFYLHWYFKKFLRDKRNKRMISLVKDDYLMIQYVHLKNTYGKNICPKDKSNQSLIYAILLYEVNRRPFILRKMDIILYRLDGLSRKFGVMQIKANRVISDEESIKRGIKRIDMISKNLSSDIKKEKRRIMILERYHYSERERDNILNIYKRVLLFEKR